MKWEDSLEKIYNELASKEPAPGGGSVSALNGVLACGLLAMLERLNQNDESEKSISEIEETAKSMARLAEKDALSYLEVASAYKLPKNTDEEKSVRNKKIQEALVNATLVPIETATTALKLVNIIVSLSGRIKKSMSSDLSVAFLSLQSCFLGAMRNINVNLQNIKNEKNKRDLQEKTKSLLLEFQTRINNMQAILKERDMSF